MSELKAYRVKGNTLGDFPDVYIKAEADKVIAEKDKVITYARALVREDIKLILHQKYKRCLAMYRYCSIKALYELDFKGNDVEWKWYSKWMHKWFKLAEQFKETK